jgi:hypothetical protein
MGLQEARWEDGGSEPAGEYIFFYGKGTENHELGTVFLYSYISESSQELGFSLLMTGYHT